MRYAMLAGWVWLGAGLVACAGVGQEVTRLDAHPVASSVSGGGGAEIDTGEWAEPLATPEEEQARRRLYEQVAGELGLEEPRPLTGWGLYGWEEAAVGGGGQAGGEQRSCAEVLAAGEPASVLSGTLAYAQDGLLTLTVPGQGPVKLRADERTCAVQAGQALLLESLQEGTEATVSFVMEEGLPTARVVRAAPVRPTN